MRVFILCLAFYLVAAKDDDFTIGIVKEDGKRQENGGPKNEANEGPEKEENGGPEKEANEGLEKKENEGPEKEENGGPENEANEGPEKKENEGPEKEENGGPKGSETEGKTTEDKPKLEEVVDPHTPTDKEKDVQKAVDATVDSLNGNPDVVRLNGSQNVKVEVDKTGENGKEVDVSITQTVEYHAEGPKNDTDADPSAGGLIENIVELVKIGELLTNGTALSNVTNGSFPFAWPIIAPGTPESSFATTLLITPLALLANLLLTWP